LPAEWGGKSGKAEEENVTEVKPES